MKKFLIIFIVFSLLLTGVFAEDSIDYSNPKVYSNSTDFLKAEGNICLGATDGCNSISIINGKLGASTMMYCENIYGNGGQEKWSCINYDQVKIKYDKYIRDNINILSKVNPVLGGTWYVTKIEWNSDDEIKVTYEDGHIEEILTLKKNDLNLVDGELICTMQYAPVCAEVQVQCIKAPCLPVQQTFGNSCNAGKNKILYEGECDSYVDVNLYNKYLLRESIVLEKISILPYSTLTQALNLIDVLIPRTKMLKIPDYFKEERVTKYIFLKNTILKLLSIEKISIGTK